MFSLYAATFLNSLILNFSRQSVNFLPFLMKSFMVLLDFLSFFLIPNPFISARTTISYNFCCL